MNNKTSLPSGLLANEAEYKEQFLEEYNNNPFIKALPTIKGKEEIIKILGNTVKPTTQEMDLDDSIRLHLLQRIYKVFQPLPVHLKIWNMIDTLIRQGYVVRNPFAPEYKRYINKLGNNLINKDFSMNVNSNFITTASCGLIVGFSGMGKTTIVNKVLENIPQIIAHNSYENKNFNNIQITWLKLEAPHNSSLKALTLQFFMKIDELIGTENMQRYVSRNLSVDAMLPLMGQLANNIGLGLLVIDELQHLNKNTTAIMNYFVALMNTFGVPLLLIGTPACYDMLTAEMRIARRVTGSGEIIWNNMKNDNEFKLFIKGIWKCQYVKFTAKLDEDMINLFYEKTQGISDLVVKLFINVQKVAIERNIEMITKELVEKVWDKEFKLIKPMIKSIESNNKAKMFKYNDIKVLNSGLVGKNAIKNEHKDNNKTDSEKVIGIKKKIKINELEDADIRRIVIEGARNRKNNYKSLLDAGVIVTIDKLIEDIKL